MFRCFSGGKSKSQEDNDRVSREIEDLLRKQRVEEQDKTKLLLLISPPPAPRSVCQSSGTGDAGKSTFLKQLKSLYKDGYTPAELEQYKWVIPAGNLLVPMQVLARHVAASDAVSKSLRRKCAKLLESDELSAESATLVAQLWARAEVRKAFEQRAEHALYLPSQAAYFFEHAQRIAAAEWTPTREDVLRAKLKTTGINEVQFEDRGSQFTVVDVGGQRSERRKWLHCFDGVTCVLFLAALDEYDMTLEEDPSTNRFDESLRLFAEVTGSRFFAKSVSWILFLNKDDLFRAKLARKPLHTVFDDFAASDAGSYDKALAYMKERYRSNFKSEGTLYEPYATCAVDSENCKRVAAAVLDTVLRNVLNESANLQLVQ